MGFLVVAILNKFPILMIKFSKYQRRDARCFRKSGRVFFKAVENPGPMLEDFWVMFSKYQRRYARCFRKSGRVFFKAVENPGPMLEDFWDALFSSRLKKACNPLKKLNFFVATL
jgi:hypothetical protein